MKSLASELLENAVAKVKAQMDQERGQGYDWALERIADEYFSLSDIERYPDESYDIIRLELELLDASDAYVQGIIDACKEVLERAKAAS